MHVFKNRSRRICDCWIYQQRDVELPWAVHVMAEKRVNWPCPRARISIFHDLMPDKVDDSIYMLKVERPNDFVSMIHDTLALYGVQTDIDDETQLYMVWLDIVEKVL